MTTEEIELRAKYLTLKIMNAGYKDELRKCYNLLDACYDNISNVLKGDSTAYCLMAIPVELAELKHILNNEGQNEKEAKQKRV